MNLIKVNLRFDTIRGVTEVNFSEPDREMVCIMVEKWCRKHCQEAYAIRREYESLNVFFFSEADAVLFKTTWG
jgi:hypothetical protein